MQILRQVRKNFNNYVHRNNIWSDIKSQKVVINKVEREGFTFNSDLLNKFLQIKWDGEETCTKEQYLAMIEHKTKIENEKLQAD